MLDFIKNSWAKNNSKLDIALRDAIIKKREDCTDPLDSWGDRDKLQYIDLFKIQIDTVVNPELDRFDKLITDKAVHSAREYQGSEILVISTETISFLPDVYITYVDYGSCSGCDTILSLYSKNNNNIEGLVSGLKTLCLHMLQRMKQAAELFGVDPEEYSPV